MTAYLTYFAYFENERPARTEKIAAKVLTLRYALTKRCSGLGNQDLLTMTNPNEMEEAAVERGANVLDVPAGARFGLLEGGTPSESGTMVMRSVALAKCLRCGFEWLPRVECPVKCPHCRTPLWNVPRANVMPGKPAPTRKGRPRGRTMRPAKTTTPAE